MKTADQPTHLWASVLRRSSPAFTLIELLVVIAVIAIPASLMLPVLSRGKEMAMKAKCQSKLRQIGLALAIYVMDSGSYPTSNSSGRGYGWLDGGIGAYLQRTDGRIVWNEFTCPGPPQLTLEYGYNGFGSGGPSQKQSLGFIEFRPDGLQDGHKYPESRLKAPSDMIVSGDFSSLPEPRYSDGREIFVDYLDFWGVRAHQWYHFRHRTGANTLFCDGHVEFATRRKLEQKSDVVRRRWNNDNEPHPETWR